MIDRTQIYKYFAGRDVDFSKLNNGSFYPVIENEEEQMSEAGVVSGFYIKRAGKEIKFILLPDDCTAIKFKTIERREGAIKQCDKPINIYIGELNAKRKEAVETLSIGYNMTKKVVEELFSKGADWGISIGKDESEERRTFKRKT